MLDRLKSILEEDYNINCSDINRDTILDADLGLSSFQFVEICARLEEELDIEIGEEQMLHIYTVGDLLDEIKEKQEVL